VSAARRRSGLLVPALVALAGVAVLVALGTWQLERKAWKEALIRTLADRLSAAPQRLPPASAWLDLTPAEAEFRRVSFRAEFPVDAAAEARFYTSGSALRRDIKAPGAFVFAPARLADGTVVVVNRGYVADTSKQPASSAAGPVTITGVLRWPEPPHWFVTSYNANDDLWFVRDHRAMAARKGWGNVAPFYVDLETQAPHVVGGPNPGQITINLPNDHLQYALTWYALALVLIAVFAAWVFSRRTEKPAAEAGG